MWQNTLHSFEAKKKRKNIWVTNVLFLYIKFRTLEILAF